MEQLWSLLKVLTDAQTKELKTLLRKPTSAAEKLVGLLLNGALPEKDIISRLKVSTSTFSKVQTQAKDYLVAIIQRDAQNPLDEVQVVQLLLMKGEIKTATKFFRALEKEYESKQKGQLLDALYIEGYRIAQLTGDLKFLEEVVHKRTTQALRFGEYVQLYGEVMIEMVRSEKFDDRKEDAQAYVQKILALNKRANQLGHHVLIHNTLVVLYHQYSRYFNNPDITWSVVQQIVANRDKWSHAMNPLTDAIVRINLINFLCIHEGYGSPEEHLADAWKRIDAGGNLAKSNLIYALLGYYLCEEKGMQVTKYLNELEKIQDKTYFASFKSIVLAIQSFIEKNYTGFVLHLNLFYNDPNHITLPDSEVIVRLLELLVLKNEMRKDKGIKQMTDEQHYQSKADALRVYFNRNLNKLRYAEEYDLLSYLITPSAKNRHKVQALLQSKYRNSRMLAKYVLAA